MRFANMYRKPHWLAMLHTKKEESMSSVRLDESVFSELRGIMGDALGEFLNTFMENSPMLIKQMESALTSGNTEALFHAAHQLKGGSGSLGATQLAELSAQIEELGKAGSMEGVTGLMQQLEDEYELLVQQLNTYL